MHPDKSAVERLRDRTEGRHCSSPCNPWNNFGLLWNTEHDMVRRVESKFACMPPPRRSLWRPFATSFHPRDPSAAGGGEQFIVMCALLTLSSSCTHGVPQLRPGWLPRGAKETVVPSNVPILALAHERNRNIWCRLLQPSRGFSSTLYKCVQFLHKNGLRIIYAVKFGCDLTVRWCIFSEWTYEHHIK